MLIIRTEQIHVKESDKLNELCHYSKNLWNEANYIVRQEFFNNRKWIRYNELDKKLKRSENYKLLDAQTSQQTLMKLDKSWKATFKGMKERGINPEKFNGQVRFPKYKEKDGKALLVFTNQQVKIKDGYLTFPKRLPMKIKTRLPNYTKLREVRIIPKGIGYTCEIVYKKLSEEGVINKRWYSRRVNKNRIIGIDLGTRNIVTIANNIGSHPIIIKGGILKSINQFYNKERAVLQSIYDKQKLKIGKALMKLTDRRNHKIKDKLHKISNFVKKFCKEFNIGTIVIGYNEG